MIAQRDQQGVSSQSQGCHVLSGSRSVLYQRSHNWFDRLCSQQPRTLVIEVVQEQLWAVGSWSMLLSMQLQVQTRLERWIQAPLMYQVQ